MAMVLRRALPSAAHVSVSWDRHWKCREAVCRYCSTVVGVATNGRMNPHGPHSAPCSGGGGATTVPGINLRNCRSALREAKRAMTGLHRTTKRR